MKDDGTTALGWARFYVRVWWPAKLRWWLVETVPRAIAWWLPRKVAYHAFVRVYSVLGECGSDYDVICKLWEHGEGR